MTKTVVANPEKVASPAPELKIEDVLESIGGFGWFQKLFSVLTIFPQLAAAMIILSPVFTGTENVPLFCTNQTLKETYSSCNVNCTMPDGDQVHSSIVQEWDLVCSKDWIVDAITSCQMAGMMTGAMVSSLIADNFGRVKGFMFVTLGMGIFGMLPALAINPVTYAIARFLAGMGMGGCFVVFLVHLMEFLTPSWRTICGAVSFWPTGEMLLGLLSYFIPSWRYLTVASSIPIFLVLGFYPYIQESPRWLLTRKRTQEAHEVLRKVAKWNSRAPPQYSVTEALQASVLKEEADVPNGLEGVKQILKNKELRLHLMILTLANITCAIVYYGVSFSARSLSGNPSLNMVYMGILDFLAIPAVLAINDRLGRRKTLIIYMTFASTFMMAILVMDAWNGATETHPLLVTIFALMGRFGIVSSWSCLTCIILESFPTTLRSSCLGFTALAGYLGGIVAPQSVFLGKISASIPYILYCVLTTTTSILSWFLCEMAGKPLKDTVNSHKI